MKRKYGNRKTVIDGIQFPSKLEAARYQQLKLLERAGQITGLELQPRFELIPKQRRADGKAERACEYVADFRYTDTATGQQVIEVLPCLHKKAMGIGCVMPRHRFV